MPTENLAEFVLYIAPGFIAVEIYRRKHPAKERSTFTQIATSLVFALVILAGIKWIDNTWLCNWLHTNSDSFPDERLIVSLIVGGIIAGYLCVIQLKIRSLLAQRFDFLLWLASEPEAIWQKVNSPQNEDWAKVHLDDGSIYIGWISKYQADPNLNDQDFLLSRAKRINEDLSEKYIVNGCGVFMNTKNVKRIEYLAGKSKS